MALIDWIPTHCTGIPEIDSENQQLVGIINKLHDSISKPNAQEVVVTCVNMLAHNFKNHCEVIEKLCLKIDYPDSNRIFKSHDRYGSELAKYLRKVQKKDKISAQALIGFLREWYNSHVLNEDQKLKKYLIYYNKQLSKPSELAGETEFIEWNNKYNINHEAIDNQHLKIVEIINKLHRAIIEKKTRGIIIEVIKELIAYTGYHFKQEEEIMAASGYPNMVAHVELHRNIIKSLEQIIIKIKNKEPFSPLNLLEFLRSWLMEHILKDDMKIGEYICQKKETVES